LSAKYIIGNLYKLLERLVFFVYSKKDRFYGKYLGGVKKWAFY